MKFGGIAQQTAHQITTQFALVADKQVPIQALQDIGTNDTQ